MQVDEAIHTGRPDGSHRPVRSNSSFFVVALALMLSGGGVIAQVANAPWEMAFARHWLGFAYISICRGLF